MSLTVAEAIASRRATRKFEDKDIPAEVLDRVVSHAPGGTEFFQSSAS